MIMHGKPCKAMVLDAFAAAGKVGVTAQPSPIVRLMPDNPGQSGAATNVSRIEFGFGEARPSQRGLMGCLLSSTLRPSS